MGVPKFYRWMSERYPCLSQVVKDYQVKGVVNGAIEVELYVPRYFTTLVCRSSAHRAVRETCVKRSWYRSSAHRAVRESFVKRSWCAPQLRLGCNVWLVMIYVSHPFTCRNDVGIHVYCFSYLNTINCGTKWNWC